ESANRGEKTDSIDQEITEKENKLSHEKALVKGTEGAIGKLKQEIEELDRTIEISKVRELESQLKCMEERLETLQKQESEIRAIMQKVSDALKKSRALSA